MKRQIGRPEKQGINYFSLDVDFDSSLEVILSQLGEKGLGIAVRVWQHIYKTKGYYMPYNEDELYMIKRICNDSSKEEIETLIRKMIDKNLFNKEIFNKKAVLTSGRLQKNYLVASRNRVSNIINKEYLIISDVSNLEETTQIRLDKIIEDKKEPNTFALEEPKVKKEKIPYDKILYYLNLKTGKLNKSVFQQYGRGKKTDGYIKGRWEDNIKKKLTYNQSLEAFHIAIDNTYAFRMEMGGDLTHMKPSTIFNGLFWERVTGERWASVNEIKKQREFERNQQGKNIVPNDIESDWLDNYIKSL